MRITKGTSKTHARQCEACGIIFYVDGWNLKHNPCRACSVQCSGLLLAGKPGKNTKFVFTEEMDAKIRETYHQMTGGGQVKSLAKQLGIPRWRVSKRATELGVTNHRLHHENPWMDEEISILEKCAKMTPSNIVKNLKKGGFDRSSVAVILKRKRLNLLQSLEGQSATRLAGCFGIDSHAILAWIHKGLLKADRRGTDRTAEQGGDSWYIKDKNVKSFIVKNIGIIDIRKVDKYWFVALLAGGNEIL